MTKNTGFTLIISSDHPKEELCAEIYYDGDYVGMISQEDSPDKPRIEIVPPAHATSWDFDFWEFVDFLKKANNEI